MPRAFQIQPQDNVATLIDDATAGVAELTGAAHGEIALKENISHGHKVAVRFIAVDEPVIKYGVRIGHATQAIPPGSWVHLHNLASDLDERSGTLELNTGAPTDTVYE